MSKMKDLELDIKYLFDKGQNPAEIARELEIPINWVYEVTTESTEDKAEDFSPFATTNS